MTDKVKNIFITFSFIALIILILFINIIKKSTIVSLSERRKLQQFPKFTVETLFNGKFFKDFDTYTMDQFVNREEFRKLKAKVETDIFNKQDYKNIYIYNNKLINMLYPLNESSVANITKKMNEIKNNYLDQSNRIYYTVIPDKNYFVDDNNLKVDYVELKKLMKDNLNWAEYIEICDLLDLDSYYTTDSHWKQEKLPNVANRILQCMDIYISTKYDKKEIIDFKGVYSGQFPIQVGEDTISILTNDILSKCSVYNFENNSYTHIYAMDKINSNDKYDIYLSGATPLLMIENPSNNSSKELVVFRDSFASSLIPLLVEGYSNITVIDTRYISPKVLDRYVNFEGKDILFAYSTMLINNSSSIK